MEVRLVGLELLLILLHMNLEAEFYTTTGNSTDTKANPPVPW